MRASRIRLVTAIAVAAAALGLAPAALAARAPTLSVRATSSQALPIQLKLELLGRRGKLSGVLRYAETCEVAGPLRGHLTSPFSGTSVSSSGHFHVGASHPGAVSLGNGYSGDLQLHYLTGRFTSRGGVSGRFDMAMTVSDSQGNVVDHCDSRTVKFQAAGR